MNGITYDGFCYNAVHQRWLESVLDRIMLSVLTDNKIPHHDKEFAQSIRIYFASSIESLQPADDNEDDKPAADKGEQTPSKNTEECTGR